MFEAAELGRTLPSKRYDTEVRALRSDLLNAHFALRGQKYPVIVIVSGADGAGKGELVHRLNEWLDPRGVETHAFWNPSDEELERPAYWRFWRAMPGRGRIGIFFGSWYTAPIIRRVYGETKHKEFDLEVDRIVAFEQMLVDDGAVLVKLWLHMPKQAQKKRIKKLEADGRAGPDDWDHYERYDKFTKVSARALGRTDSGAAPWHVIEATDRNYREVTAGTILLEAIQAKLKAATSAPVTNAVSVPEKPAKAKGAVARPRTESVLGKVDLSQRLTDAEYGRQIERLQSKLSKLAWAAHAAKRSMVMVFEGWDAAGKGSASRRVTNAMDPRLYRVIGFAAPTDEERAQHYLWRFWRHLPRAGYSAIFDRSWYGRVLVERVEGFTAEADWSRAYHEINEFEEQLTSHGMVVNKFWLHISKDEQLRRFKERQTVTWKQYKITDEDWRNRKKWPEYERAVDDMVARCSSTRAPWTLVAGNDKRFARVQILKTVVRRLEAAL
ncbi:MAG: polyphosphate:AMP phosphotransferase [Gemmatimonadota bacterium]